MGAQQSARRLRGADRDAASDAPTPLQRHLRLGLAAGYLLVVALGFWGPWQPRLFWTVLLPLLPIAIVLMGFSTWRRICPLAFWGELGSWVKRGKQRRVPKWMENHFFPLTFVLLLSMLGFRLLGINGDGAWLSATLLGLALAAAATNLVFTGKSWCNFVCPVGLVERIYTEPGSLRSGGSSQCVRCTACKKNCPDIDQENAYWKDMGTQGRRLAYYAFPGLVFAFYFYYWLRGGSWEAYFDGQWTLAPVDAPLVLGPGFFFTESVPAILAAPLTLVTFSLLSAGIFLSIERLVARFVTDEERLRHRMLALAAFAAFNIFYLFAGAPTFRRISGAAPLVAFIAPSVACLVLVKRWGRSQTHFLQAKGAGKLLKKWPSELPVPAEPSEVFAYFKARDQAREEHLGVYRDLVADVVGDGIVTSDEERVLELMRIELGIGAKEHERILSELSDTEQKLFAPENVATVERRAQQEGYEKALIAALRRGASTEEVEAISQAFAVDDGQRVRTLARLRGDSGPLMARARECGERLSRIRADLAAASVLEGIAAEFIGFVLRQQQQQTLSRALELLELLGGEGSLGERRGALLSPNDATRKRAWEEMRESGRMDEGLIGSIETFVNDDSKEMSAVGPARAVQRFAEASDPYLRAAALMAAGELSDPDLPLLLEGAANDCDALVRDTASRLNEGIDAHSDASPSRGPYGSHSDRALAELGTLDRIIHLHRVPLFGDLDPAELHELSELCSEEEVAPPRILCEQGEQGDDLFVIVRGEAVVSVRAVPGGEARELGTCAMGDVIGELAVIDGSPRSATVRPVGVPIRVLRIRGREFRESLLHRSGISPTLMATLAGRLRNATRLVGS